MKHVAPWLAALVLVLVAQGPARTDAPSARWEYRVERWNVPGTEDLKSLGAEGWDLVHVEGDFHYLRRPAR